jgi:hypothetical protein
MVEVAKRPNHAAWIALLLGIGSLSVNFVFFANPPLQAALPWLGLLLGIAAVVGLVISLRRAFTQSQIYRGRWFSILLALLTLPPTGASLFVFVHARALPNSSAAPQVGQRVPDFTLSDTNGASVSLDNLLSSFGDSSSAAPKAVLLIFYRGYW